MSVFTKVGDIEVVITNGPSTTIAVVVLINQDEEGNRVSVKEFVGEAKRHPRDVEDRDIGEGYAVGRALRSAADSMIANADQLVMKNDPYLADHWIEIGTTTENAMKVFAAAIRGES